MLFGRECHVIIEMVSGSVLNNSVMRLLNWVSR